MTAFKENFRADLHCHSTCSDGSLSPEEIVILAKEIGLKGLSITDHDTIAAYASAEPAAKKLGISLISGVEFSAVHKDVSVHILGYSFSLNHPAIVDFCQKHQERRKNRNRLILEKLQKKGIDISEKEVLECASESSSNAALLKHTIGRPHIAKVLMKKNYVDSIKNAFRIYLGEAKSCYAQGVLFSVEETLSLIHQAGGLAIIAHPHLIKSEKVIKDLSKMPFDGIECYYAKFNSDQNKRWIAFAQKHHWLMTGGSDFHGSIKPDLCLGSSFVEEETFRVLEQHYLQAIE